MVTIEDLKAAISNVLDKSSGRDREWIDQIAQFVMDFFGYEERILDNRLNPKDRDIFYMLEGMGLLRTEMEEATLQKGKVWRIHYWILNKERIDELLKKKEPLGPDSSTSPEQKVYESIPDAQWVHKDK